MRSEWTALDDHHRDMDDVSIKSLFDADDNRFDAFHLAHDGFVFDYSKNRVTPQTMNHLSALARASGVEKARDDMLSGAVINTSEERAVLHMALRGTCDDTLEIDGENVCAYVDDALGQMRIMSNAIRQNSEITDVINIGIGGSDLGPRMVYDALIPHKDGPNVHFISNVDGAPIDHLMRTLSPRNTLIIITSKTFTTLETLTNAKTAKAWLESALSAQEVRDRLVAVTVHADNARAFGVADAQILPLRNWIGGRFSLWSAVGLPIAVAFGFDVFEDLLAGAHSADQHFIDAPLDQNIPVIMAMIGVWHRNFCGYQAHAVLPYTQRMHPFPAYLQQLDMESNGKRVGLDGALLSHATGPIIFGESGTNAQHAFMQLLHQGRDIIPADFIMCAQPDHAHDEHHTQLISNALAQSKALMDGSADDAVERDTPHRYFPGNRPSSTFMMTRLDAKNLGMLLAFYEHKIFVQGVVWGINSFDQWGVELGKNIAKCVHKAIDDVDAYETIDSSTAGLLALFREKFIKS